jgi:hypothetical protein
MVWRVGDFLGDYLIFPAEYIVPPERQRLVIAAWTCAAWLADLWARFPHLGVTSPQKRSAKSRLLAVLAKLLPYVEEATSISPAALFRLIKEGKDNKNRRYRPLSHLSNEPFVSPSPRFTGTRYVGDSRSPTSRRRYRCRDVRPTFTTRRG